ncbi:hypothetical protein G7B40_021940 [Aetokthonos hydrillicola Thurmond2011]|jgi:hypothetical protein|uniref:Uncharacterized protein n=1 Tax=Aetokthonos hydrillicola Thurmond2011 TaxID=2712845 RepID=A0AAP5I998_9CYAN|nr:hypothetical protein [Aetokthonos hydrillicola]MBO3457828.1 hypothetical protein [Aetokthonos hydrillicola CCALA 1050]MBW4588314.1 hypothetical protein [Aetokthonos hydrillicola CCALA 1050]MDR9897205.1 hypothetical protein [Aetokthonos hydrillicola Thurmond2011]
MSFTSCSCCVVVLNQQEEQNNYHQHQCEQATLNEREKPVKTATVVENGRVVIKQLQSPAKQSSQED